MEEIRALRKETEDRRKEIDRKHEEDYLKHKEEQRKIEEMIKELSRKFGGLNGSMGQLVEDLLSARLHERFKGFPYQFSGAYRNMPILNENRKVVGEVDCLLVNCEYIMAVEIKRHVKKDDVEHHIKRMELVRKYLPFVRREDKLLGALAGATVEEDARDYAYSAGFFVLELTGDSVGLAERPAGFTPKEW
jgi:hypothetical protein